MSSKTNVTLSTGLLQKLSYYLKRSGSFSFVQSTRFFHTIEGPSQVQGALTLESALRIALITLRHLADINSREICSQAKSPSYPGSSSSFPHLEPIMRMK